MKKEMTEQELQELTEYVSEQYFNKKFNHEALWNKKLRTTGGRYILTTHNIEVNPKHLEIHGEEELVGIIKHELCHYHLHIEGKGYQHRDADFKMLLRKVGAPRFCKSVIETKAKTLLVYQCRTCEQKYMRKRAVSTERYRCGKCKGEITFLVKTVDI